MNIIPKEFHANFWGVIYALFVLLVWYLLIQLVEVSSIQDNIPSILVNNDTHTLAGLVSHTLQLAAFFAALRLLLPSKPIKHEIGCPVFGINLDKMTEPHVSYGQCNALTELA